MKKRILLIILIFTLLALNSENLFALPRPGSPRAVIWSPYQTELGAPVVEIRTWLGKVDYEVYRRLDYKATVDGFDEVIKGYYEFKFTGDYGVYYIATHGGEGGFAIQTFKTKEERNEAFVWLDHREGGDYIAWNDLPGPDGKGDGIDDDEPWLKNKWDSRIQIYKAKSVHGFHISAAPAFALRRGGRFPQSLFYVRSCDSFSTRLRNVYLGKGCYAYIGYPGTSWTPASNDWDKHFFIDMGNKEFTANGEEPRPCQIEEAIARVKALLPHPEAPRPDFAPKDHGDLVLWYPWPKFVPPPVFSANAYGSYIDEDGYYHISSPYFPGPREPRTVGLRIDPNTYDFYEYYSVEYWEKREISPHWGYWVYLYERINGGEAYPLIRLIEEPTFIPYIIWGIRPHPKSSPDYHFLIIAWGEERFIPPEEDFPPWPFHINSLHSLEIKPDGTISEEILGTISEAAYWDPSLEIIGSYQDLFYLDVAINKAGDTHYIIKYTKKSFIGYTWIPDPFPYLVPVFERYEIYYLDSYPGQIVVEPYFTTEEGKISVGSSYCTLENGEKIYLSKDSLGYFYIDEEGERISVEEEKVIEEDYYVGDEYAGLPEEYQYLIPNNPPIADVNGPYFATTEIIFDLKPDTLNISSEGRWVTAYLWTDPLSSVEIILDGSFSFDPEGEEITYDWTILDTGGNEIPVEDVVKPTISLSPGNYEVNLVVNDGEFDSSLSQTTITIEPIDLSAIDISKLILNGIYSDWGELQDLDEDGFPETLMVKFPRPLSVGGVASTITLEDLEQGEVEMNLSGENIEETVILRVVSAPGRKRKEKEMPKRGWEE